MYTVGGLNRESHVTAALLYTLWATFPGNHVTFKTMHRVIEGFNTIPAQLPFAPLLVLPAFSGCSGLYVLR